jgi:hypothetical protein
MPKLRYSNFANQIDVDAFEEAIGFDVIETRGSNDIGHCLFPYNHMHGDTTGKFAIEREAKLYNCWVCGGGDFVSLVMELYHCDVDDAVHWLYEYAHGDERDDHEFLEDFLKMADDVEQRTEHLPYFNDRVLDTFDDGIEWAKNDGESWLARRNISLDIANTFGLRYKRETSRMPPRSGRYAEYPAHIGPSIIFPHYWFDRLVGWQQRWLGDRPDWLPKYTNTSDFPKENTIYNYHKAIKSKDRIIVAESVPSVVYLEGQGYSAVATFGDSINPAQLRLLRRFRQGVILAPDNDKAGRKWLSANTNYLKRFLDVWHLPFVEGEKSDVGDLTDSNRLDEYISLAYQPEFELEERDEFPKVPERGED